MGKAKHTPGPWTAHDLTGTPVNDPSVMSEKHCIATVWINDIPRKQAAANASLIAAAPELLDTLRALMRHAKTFGAFRDDFGEGVKNYCDDIIAKAEGRS